MINTNNPSHQSSRPSKVYRHKSFIILATDHTPHTSSRVATMLQPFVVYRQHPSSLTLVSSTVILLSTRHTLTCQSLPRASSCFNTTHCAYSSLSNITITNVAF